MSCFVSSSLYTSSLSSFFLFSLRFVSFAFALIINDQKPPSPFSSRSRLVHIPFSLRPFLFSVVSISSLLPLLLLLNHPSSSTISSPSRLITAPYPIDAITIIGHLARFASLPFASFYSFSFALSSIYHHTSTCTPSIHYHYLPRSTLLPYPLTRFPTPIINDQRSSPRACC